MIPPLANIGNERPPVPAPSPEDQLGTLPLPPPPPRPRKLPIPPPPPRRPPTPALPPRTCSLVPKSIFFRGLRAANLRKVFRISLATARAVSARATILSLPSTITS